MEYRVKTIFNKEEIESCQRFSMDHFMWTCLQKPEAYGWMGYLKDQGLFVKLVCKEKDPKRVYHNFMDMVCEDSAMEVFLAFPEKGEALTNDVMYLIPTVRCMQHMGREEKAVNRCRRNICRL